MNRQEYLLTSLAEECCEVGQRVSKALRFGLYEVQSGQRLRNRDRIVEELQDLRTLVQMLIDEGTIPPNWTSETAAIAKREKVEKYINYAIGLGTIT